MACGPSEDSDQPGHPSSLIKVFAVRVKKAWVLSYLLSAQRRLWSDWADAQADLSLRWGTGHYVCFFIRRTIFCPNIIVLAAGRIWAASWQNQQNGICAQRRIRSAWASTQSDQSSLSAWRKLGSLAIHWVHSKDSDQTGRMPRLIWIFAGCRVILLVCHEATHLIYCY